MVADISGQAISLQLPVSVITNSDVGRLVRELETVDALLNQSAIQQAGVQPQLPALSRILNEIVASNKLNILNPQDRLKLAALLKSVHDTAPVLHMGFSVDPSPIFLQRLMTWLRLQIHPHVLVQVGLLPNIGAGCALRTTNKYFDFSLRQRFADAQPLLIAKLRADAEAEPVAAASQEPTS